MIQKTILAATLATLSVSVMAAPPALEAAKKGGVEVVKEFPVEGSKIKGYVLKVGGNFEVIYGDETDKFIISGDLINADGQNLTAEHKEKFVPKPDFTQAWKMLEDVPMKVKMNPKAKGKTLYVIADANCIFCHYIDKAMMPYAETGKVDVQLVHVGVLRADSANKAAAIMTAKDPSAALKEHSKNFKQGGIKGVTPTTEVTAALAQGKVIMEFLQATGTPAVVYKDEQGKVQVIKGMPSLSQIATITGLSKIENKDPDLSRFDR